MFNAIGQRLGNVWNTVKGNLNNSVLPALSNIGAGIQSAFKPNPQGSGALGNLTQSLSVPTANAQTVPTSFDSSALSGGGLTINQQGGGIQPSAPTLQPGQRFYGDTGSAQDNAAWQYSQGLSQNLQSLGGPSTSLPPKNFSLSSGDGTNFSSSSTNGNTSYQDALNYRNQQQNSLLNGTAPFGTTPSDMNLGNIVGDIYGASQYSPQESAALGNYNTLQARILATQLAGRRQVQNLYENGSITKEQGQGFISDAQRRADQQLADLQTQQAGNTLDLQTFGMLRNNQLGALQNIAGFFKPETVSPGSSLMNAFGQNIGQNGAAAPIQIADLANQLATRDQQYGTIKTLPDGSPDYNYYRSQAQGFLTGQAPSYSGGNVQGGTQQAPGGSYVPQGYGGGIQALPPNLQSYADQSTINGNQVAFINSDRVPAALQPAAQAAARQAGIPYLSNNDVQGVQAVQIISQALDQAQALAVKTLKPGVGGHIADTLINWANNYLQFNPVLQNFGVLRDTAAKSVTALAGGVGSGLRLNLPEIQIAVSNMPTAGDNIETATTKVQALRTLLNNQLSTKFPQLTGQGNLTNTGQPQTSQGNPFSPQNFYGSQ